MRDSFDLSASDERHGSRHGWDEAFRRMAESGDDALLDGDASMSEWDDTECEW